MIGDSAQALGAKSLPAKLRSQAQIEHRSVISEVLQPHAADDSQEIVTEPERVGRIVAEDAGGNQLLGLDDDPFDYRITRSGLLIISRSGRTVMELGGRKAAASIPKLGSGEEADQQLLARVTGSYRRGNERHSQRSH